MAEQIKYKTFSLLPLSFYLKKQTLFCQRRCTMIRSPAVAGKFYPGSEASLLKTLQALIPEIRPEDRQAALAVVAPHAGYIYSGGVAGETFARVKVPESVVILGPNHTGHGAPVALMAQGTWDMPMGEVAINKELAALIAEKAPQVAIDEMAHHFEHSLEVQVPFLQYMQKNLSIAPIVVSHVSYETCVSVGQGLAAAIKSLRQAGTYRCQYGHDPL